MLTLMLINVGCEHEEVMPMSINNSDNVQQDLKHHLTLSEAADLAQNCPLWKMMLTYGATQS